MDVAKCAKAHDAYISLTNYAVTELNLPNVAMYLDAGHAGWLGWPANQGPAAKLFASIYKDAGKPAALRGLATNVANYNAWSLSSAPPYTQGASIYDEKSFIHAMGPLLEQNGWPGAHFITDQGRSGKQPTGQIQWGDWCNSKGTGFGIRPSANTGDSLLDAFVWVKPGGESDGTSDTSATRYDYHCGASAALQYAIPFHQPRNMLTSLLSGLHLRREPGSRPISSSSLPMPTLRSFKHLGQISKASLALSCTYLPRMTAQRAAYYIRRKG